MRVAKSKMRLALFHFCEPHFPKVHKTLSTFLFSLLKRTKKEPKKERLTDIFTTFDAHL